MTFRGESAKFDLVDIDFRTLEMADWVQISSLGGNIDLLDDVVNFCYQKGIRVGVNPGIGEISDKKKLISIVKKVDLLCLNRQEAALLGGIDFNEEREIANFISNVGVKFVVVSDGKRGASVIRNQLWLKMDAYKNKSVDDTGAGDAFVVGVVDGYINNKDIDDCLEMGIANGSSVVSFMGAKKGLLRKAEVLVNKRKKLKVVEERLS